MSNQLIDHVTETLDKARDGDGRETIDNTERGCGHLDPNGCYVRSDLAALGGPGGEIPAFVELKQPVEYREHTGRGAIIPGYKAFPGTSFLKHYQADGRVTAPPRDVDDHIDRLGRHGFSGDHYADIVSARSVDLLMSVGTSNYETPKEYIDECRERGLNLKIPASKNQEPPVIEPLRTRVFVIHPHGAGDGRPAIIGYAYATRNVFTTGTKASADDPDVPGWADDFATTRNDFDLVDRGEPIDKDDVTVDDAQTTINQVSASPTDVDAEAVVDSDPVKVQASDKPGRDVEEVPDDDTDPKGSGGDDDDLTGSQVVDLKQIDYNVLKAWAGTRDDVDPGQSPPKDDLIEAARERGIDAATVRRSTD